jgi:general secretion pathway protein G
MEYREFHSFERRGGRVNTSGVDGSSVHKTNTASGFTLVEIIIVAGLIATLSMIIVPRLLGYTQRNREMQAIVDITKMNADIAQYIMDFTVPPDSLADVGYENLRDPWGNPYQYLKIIDNADPGVNGKRRKDHSLVPVNSDYDLYSMGPDGKTGAPFTDSKSRDDIVRASNGAFIGPVSEF